MLKLGTSSAAWVGGAGQDRSFETPSSLVVRLDRELDAVMPAKRRSSAARTTHIPRPEIVDRAGRAVTHGLSETVRLFAHIALAGALGVMSARIVQLIASMG